LKVTGGSVNDRQIVLIICDLLLLIAVRFLSQITKRIPNKSVSLLSIHQFINISMRHPIPPPMLQQDPSPPTLISSSPNKCLPSIELVALVAAAAGVGRTTKNRFCLAGWFACWLVPSENEPRRRC
jgi:hypothetical protein